MRINTGSVMPELVLIVDPKAGIRVRNGIISGENAKGLAELLQSAQALMRPLYGISEDELNHRLSSTETLMGEDQLLDLSIFYKITCSPNKFGSLGARLRELSTVQAAYIKPPADLPFIDDYQGEEGVVERSTFLRATDDFTRVQGYLNSASEGGIDARYAWTKNGGRGTDIKIIDIEGAWRFSHEDLIENPSGCVGGVSISDGKWRKHGTAVLGMLGGDHNGFGVAGICPDAKVRTVSIFNNANGDASPDWGSAAAIRCAADLLSPGDVILLELHRPGPAVNFQENETNQDGYIPVEWWPCDMAAIQYATERGREVVVVEAAGNGRENLGNRIYNQNPAEPHGPFPKWWVNPFKRNPVDTQAILVGAGLPPDGTNTTRMGPDRSRFMLSNFGAVVDTQGWGAEVATCGGNGDLTPGAPADRRYTRRFNGTSSAAAMVTGALCCLQGVLRPRGKTLKPFQARSLLRDNSLGSPQQDGPLSPAHLEPIGPRPDLKKLIDHF